MSVKEIIFHLQLFRKRKCVWAQIHLARLVLLGDADYDVALDIVGAGDLDVELRVHRRSL